jgi:hypothetical protein
MIDDLVRQGNSLRNSDIKSRLFQKNEPKEQTKNEITARSYFGCFAFK